MKLLNLVNYFRQGGSYEEFCKQHSLNIKSEVIEIYMTTPLSSDNELSFFEIDKTNGKVIYNHNGIEYSNLFDFYYFLDTIEESNNDENRSISDEELTQVLFNYALNDA